VVEKQNPGVRPGCSDISVMMPSFEGIGSLLVSAGDEADWIDQITPATVPVGR